MRPTNRILKKVFLYLYRKYLADTIDDRVRWLRLHEPRIFGDHSRLKIAPTATVNDALFNLSSGTITVGDHVSFGHNVSLITGTHDYTKYSDERQQGIPPKGRDIVVKRGCWIASNATIIGPCIIGEHSVVGAGALVLKDVPADVLVVGVPARFLKNLVRVKNFPAPV
jgi:acetyltransferase-like isoleucine patch superfamily enzyme